MESLLASNEEKVGNVRFWTALQALSVTLGGEQQYCLGWLQDRRIEELSVLLGQCRKIRDVLALTQGGSPQNVRPQIFVHFLLQK